ncbi:TetR family transcriptional regulator [Paenibacillus sp. 598K]|uniref:TetR/AcrR family transcriptional regulator n=1 Tax=Paenibacillus sp. 598K TaxID=1117987 RepID=UPI000FF94C71|nr:TetR/AcrR family transcriptional regulator [Paenibacillus sp. 598K]GBF72976.1 TetR family transcriptional regulator [Paenibacillus sp. 598K]
MKNEERRKQTTRQLIEATQALLEERSCHLITIQDVMARSRLSKGAIFHYVKSRDELFALVLQERLEALNERFFNAVNASQVSSFDGPMRAIADNLIRLEDPSDITNKVLFYLAGKEDDPAVAEALRQFHDQSVRYTREWISTGQRHGVIKSAVDASVTAELFVMLSLGLRMRASLQPASTSLSAAELADYMGRMLRHTERPIDKEEHL